MRLAIHIFRKDVRRLRLAILVSLVALVVLACVEWLTIVPSEENSYREVGRLLPVIVVFSWWMLIVRLVHGEALVGERQFWRTRPYAWQQLLGAKTIFLLTCVAAPLALSWSVLLLVGRIPLLPTLGPMIFSRAGGVLLSIFTCMLIATLTRTVTQWLLWSLLLPLLTLLLILSVRQSFVSQPNCPLAAEAVQILTAIVFAGFIIGGIVLQYWRREWWPGALALLFAIVAASLMGLGVSNRFIVEKLFPIAEDSEVAIRANFVPAKKAERAPDDSSSAGDRVSLGFPVSVQIADNALVRLDAVMLSLYLPNGQEWKSEAERGSVRLIVAGEQEFVASIGRSVYERIRAASLNGKLVLAFSEFREASREAVRVRRAFDLANVGSCGIDGRTKSLTVVCITGGGGQASLSTITCGGAVRRTLDFYESSGLLSPLTVRYTAGLCGNGSVTFSALSEKRRFRIEINLGKVRLQDYPPADNGISFDLR